MSSEIGHSVQSLVIVAVINKTNVLKFPLALCYFLSSLILFCPTGV